MNKRNGRLASLILGGAVLAGLAGYPLVSRTYGADREREERIERERHPKIHAALEALRAAREELNAAEHDFGGHKKEAIESIDRAIHHLELAHDFDRK